MSIRPVDSDFDKSSYNRMAPHPLQSWEWGAARRKMGIEVVRLGEFDGDRLKNVFQITFHKIPYTSFKVGYLPRSAIPSKQLLAAIAYEGKKRSSIFVKIEPYVKKNEKGKMKKEKDIFQISNLKSQIRKSSHPLFPKWTLQIDLTKSEDELLKGMKPKTRYNIRLAQRKGVVVKEMTNDEGFEIFAKLYFETTKRHGYRGHDAQYHRTVFETLKDKISHIFIAYYKNTPLSAYEIFTFNDVLYYPYGGSSLEYRNLMASNLLMWEVVRYGKKLGSNIFDMWGSLPPSYASTKHSTGHRSATWAGFTRFKEGFGGEFVEMVGSWDLVLKPSIYLLYVKAYAIREQILGII